jgi:hypothetical protein
VYVGVLYYVTPKEHRHGWSRDDPAVIRRRALAVSAVTVLSPLGLAAISAPDALVSRRRVSPHRVVSALVLL